MHKAYRTFWAMDLSSEVIKAKVTFLTFSKNGYRLLSYLIIKQFTHCSELINATLPTTSLTTRSVPLPIFMIAKVSSDLDYGRKIGHMRT